MTRKWIAAVSGSLVAGLCAAGSLSAAPNWGALVPFKKIDADPKKEYLLTQDHGPWLIMCRAFAGETAHEEAHALVLELRQQYKLKAYLHLQEWDFTQRETGKGFDMYGVPKKMKPANPSKFMEYAVLVGDFEEVDDPKVQDVLDKIKEALPACLDVQKGEGQSQRYWGLRVVSRAKAGAKERGPMRMAFVTRNPMLPDEFFVSRERIDPLVKEMNKGLKYSLLKNPGNYTVRIATFRGRTQTTIRAKDLELAKKKQVAKSTLGDGEEKAHALVLALRETGVEAYEFHDVNESMVTVGSFNTVGEPRPDGKTEINPAVLAVIDTYKAPERQVVGQGTFGAKKVAGITLDVQPIAVVVPKDAVGSRVARRGSEQVAELAAKRRQLCSLGRKPQDS